MNLFINAVSSNWKLILFTDKKKIISDKDILVVWNESSKLTSIIDNFLLENNIVYNTINNIVVVSWPWSFTWVRAISLIVNTIAFTSDAYITDISFFDLFDNYPILKSSSKRDSFVKKDKVANIEVIKNEEILKYLSENDIVNSYWDLTNNYLLDNFKLNTNINYSIILDKIKFLNKKIISPLYIKKPTIS